jgi:hypothetical protein
MNIPLTHRLLEILVEFKLLCDETKRQNEIAQLEKLFEKVSKESWTYGQKNQGRKMGF